MKYTIFIFVIFLISNITIARSIGETEIITDEGIEVFQKEKYYLLKKNVRISSDDFSLSGNYIKVFFGENLYDISQIEAKEDVELKSKETSISSNGQNLNFDIKNQKLLVFGQGSELFIDNIKMFSDEKIEVNNVSGKFILYGENSRLVGDNIFIRADFIDGIFINESKGKKIDFLFVSDKNISYVKSDNTEMYAKNIRFDNKSSLIELEDDVKIIRDGEIITGGYGSLNTKTNSYKIKSNPDKKVKVIISNDDK